MSLFAVNENLLWIFSDNLTINAQGFTSRIEISNAIIDRVDVQDLIFTSIFFANSLTGYATDFAGHIFKNSTGLLNILNVELKKSFNFYPNPASSNVTISFTELSIKNPQITITDTLGKEIFYNSYSNLTSCIIDTQKFQKGIYLMTIKFGDYIQTEKLIIN